MMQLKPLIGELVPIPVSIQHQLTLQKNSIKMEAQSEMLNSFLLKLSAS